LKPLEIIGALIILFFNVLVIVLKIKYGGSEKVEEEKAGD